MPSEKWLQLKDQKEFFTPEEEYLHRKLERKNCSSINDSRELSFSSSPARPLAEAGPIKELKLSILQIHVQQKKNCSHLLPESLSKM